MHEHQNADTPMTGAQQALADLWGKAGMSVSALDRVNLMGEAHGFPSSFAVDVAAQSAVAAAALVATEIDLLRSPEIAAQQVGVDVQHVLAETTGYFELDGTRPSIWSPISGLYACGAETEQPGFVRVHANFDHHRDGVLRLLNLPEGTATQRAQVTEALRRWRSIDCETASTKAGLVVAAARSADEWHAHPMHDVIAAQSLVSITQIDESAPAAPREWPGKRESDGPLHGLKMLDLTRILAGPVGARTLAAYGADVLMINSPHLPNIESIADMSRGKRSALLDLKTNAGQAQMHRLLGDAHVFIQGYRPGAMDALGLGIEQVAQLRPGIVYASLSAYGRSGPWADKRGFDSLVQTVSGINLDEMTAFHGTEPRALPMQILDFCAGFLLAFGIQAALLRQKQQGGTWQVDVSLARVAQWLRELGRRPVEGQPPAGKLEDLVKPWLETSASGFGELRGVTHAAQFSRSQAQSNRPSMPPGTDQPVWL